MAIGPSAVERWLDLSTEELRAQVTRLVSARLPGDHAVWQAIRRHQALVPRIRGVLSGLAATSAGSKDEAMQKVWISKARAALDQPFTPPVKAARKPAAEEVPAEEPEPVIELREPEPAQQKQPHKAIPTMLFQEPS
ncbi:hypothetical protein SAMN04488074_11581 [Lentzea albidocapillata subsp. violacea]|uniref:Uncharacterized protein n=1 Tax=Lentzea albidocapillata subsp. violacea TaxID=128104 RepID=A0A1G9PLH9_9PSEU|nr:hypothetical protein [Lentzea albidocapillata]SDL98935.1 hypothetical protein SAMN04488074_11581 [Lentzea albidocapillata subsp. violacea]